MNEHRKLLAQILKLRENEYDTNFNTFQVRYFNPRTYQEGGGGDAAFIQKHILQSVIKKFTPKIEKQKPYTFHGIKKISQMFLLRYLYCTAL